MRFLALRVADLQFVRLDQSRNVCPIPIGDRLVVLAGLIFTPMFKADDCPLAKGHQIRQQKPVCRFDLVVFVLRLAFTASAGRVAGKWQSHVASTPVISAPAPFLCPRSVSLRCSTVIKEKTRVALQRIQRGAMRENPRSADETAGPLTAAL